MTEPPRLIPIGNFESEALSHLVIPAGALAKVEAAIAAERLAVGDHVAKVSGDCHFRGVIVAAFVKRDGKTLRYVAEDDRGLLHIFNAAQLARSP